MAVLIADSHERVGRPRLQFDRQVLVIVVLEVPVVHITAHRVTAIRKEVTVLTDLTAHGPLPLILRGGTRGHEQHCDDEAKD